MSNEKEREIVKNIVPKTEIETEEKQLNLIYKLLRERHELRQVSLMIYRGLKQTDKMSLVEFNWESELQRVLFEEEIFLYCSRDLPENLGEEE